jgi:hypothetical protein
MFYINKRIVSDTWTAVDVGSPDITGVLLKTLIGIILIFNFHCDIENSDSIKSLQKYIQARNTRCRVAQGQEHMIWLGDFNCHYPLWDEH